MINFNEIYTQKTNEAFANIEKTGLYKGRLLAVKISKQTGQYVEEGKEPKHLVSFVWDCKNKAGEHVHVSTKPCTISFTDKSTLPKIWENMATVNSLETFLSTVYTKNNEVKDIFATLDIKVDVKDNGNFPTVTKISEVEDVIKDFGTSKVTDYDRKVYGVDAISMDINPVYEGKAGVIECETEEDFINRLANS